MWSNTALSLCRAWNTVDDKCVVCFYIILACFWDWISLARNGGCLLIFPVFRCLLVLFGVTLRRARKHLLSVFLYISVLGQATLHVHFVPGLRLFTQSVVHVYLKTPKPLLALPFCMKRYPTKTLFKLSNLACTKPICIYPSLGITCGKSESCQRRA